ncbi:hypothetical protein PtA15_7A555 [Puccinia triticina]|uniref:Uncharacterized protein n=1 Tax=Puccinia triticina TaxID=208348 RepID=A0ABY7CNK6_9BASI|nr:uncharacterized protein PtA15_7A555 [Puccinia triticina]WAQ86826.1 hypothetical protein PtA15_7A555 [Puccinia triticina]
MKLNHDILELVSQWSWKTYGESLAKEMKTFLNPYHGYFLRSFEMDCFDSLGKLWARKYAFKTIGFLLKNQFIDENNVREIFQDEEMVKHVILYTRVLFKEHGLGNIFGGVRYFTEHYKWTSLDPSFKCSLG